MRRSVFTLFAVVSISGCYVGTGDQEAQVQELLNPPGRTVVFTFRNQPWEGELLGFRNDSAFVFHNNEIYAVPDRALRGVERKTLEWSQPGTNVTLEELRKHARYPIGISPQLETALLAKLNQTQVHR